MTHTAFTLNEFVAEHGDPLYVPHLGRHVTPDAASMISMAGATQFHDPPDTEFEKFSLLVARQAHVVDLLAQQFVSGRAEAMAGGSSGAIPLLKELAEKHDAEFAKLEQLRRQLAATPRAIEAVRQRKLAADSLEQRLMTESSARAEIGGIQLCTERGNHPTSVKEKEED